MHSKKLIIILATVLLFVSCSAKKEIHRTDNRAKKTWTAPHHPTPPSPPPPPEEEALPKVREDGVFIKPDVMPRFPGCEFIDGDDEARSKCAEKEMLEFLYGDIKYPAVARKNHIEGEVVATFIVRKDGHISDIKIVSGVSPEIDQEVVRVVQKMIDEDVVWIPGQNDGKPVDTLYRLPMKFRLN